jgi:adenylate kinase family enzyme
MVNIHISGSPGTGKTTLGIKLKSLFPKYKIVETDGFITDNNRKKRNSIKDSKSKIKFIKSIYKKKFNYYDNKYKKIIYIGILDSSIPDGSLYIRNFDYKIFMTISNKEYLKRYYGREPNSIDKEIDLLNSKKIDIKRHKKLKYIMLKENQIIDLIKKIDI